MKIQTSRESHRADSRYAGVYQQQGRMITDADWNELMEIVGQRRREALGDVVRDGAPREGGLRVDPDLSGGVRIVPGHLYAGGTLARLPGTGPVAYADQPDLPHPPPLPAGGDGYVLYADVWERTLTSLEDDGLRDAALHGADTCARTQTMVQVKWSAPDLDPEDPDVNPQRGDARLGLELRRTLAPVDPCDPCGAAELGEDPSRIGNYLFRVEVHDVRWDAQQGRVDRLTLKWSAENGAEQYAAGFIPQGFPADDHAYEFFSDATEKHLGLHLVDAEGFPRRGLLTAGYPDDVDDAAYAYVRRWDGFVALRRVGNRWELDETRAFDRGRPLTTSGDSSADGFVSIGSSLTVNLRSVILSVELTGRVFVPGDYWTAAVREQVHAISDVVLEPSPPTGIAHRYLTLGRVRFPSNGGPPAPQLAPPTDDAARRRLEFPSLTTLQASDVGVVDGCARLYDGAENVQQALDALCDIDATDVAYEVPGCTDSGGGQPTVQTLLGGALGGDWDGDGDARVTVGDVLDALLCRLNAAGIPYDPTAQRERWEDVTEAGLGAPPQPSTVQGALDTLVENLESSDIGYVIPECPPGEVDVPGIAALLGMAGETDVKALWDRVLCGLNAGTLPVGQDPPLPPPLNPGAVKTVQDALRVLAGREGGGGGLAGVMAALANAVGVMPDGERRGALREAPVSGEGSLAHVTVGLGVDLLRVAASLLFELLDLKGTVETHEGTTEIGTSASVNLLALVRPETRASLTAQVAERASLLEGLQDGIVDTVACVVAEFLEDHGVRPDAVLEFGERYGGDEGYNGPGARQAFLRIVYEPLFGRSEISHWTLARLRVLVLDLVGRLWRRFATDLLIHDPPALTPCAVDWKWVTDEGVLRALGRALDTEGLVRLTPASGDIAPAAEPRVVMEQVREEATWIISGNVIEGYNHAGIRGALRPDGLEAGSTCPRPDQRIAFGEEEPILHAAPVLSRDRRMMEVATQRGSAISLYLVPLDDLVSLEEGELRPAGTLPFNGALVLGDGRQESIVHQRSIGSGETVDRFLAGFITRTAVLRSGATGTIVATYHLPAQGPERQPSEGIIVEEVDGRQRLLLFAGRESPWWLTEELTLLSYTQLHRDVTVVGVAHDQIILQVVPPTRAAPLWTFLPYRTLREELWGAGDEQSRFADFWATPHPDGSPLFRWLDGGAPIRTARRPRHPLPLHPGGVRRAGQAGVDGWLTVLLEDGVAGLYQCFRDVLPERVQSYQLSPGRSAVAQVRDGEVLFGDATEQGVHFDLGAVTEI